MKKDNEDTKRKKTEKEMARNRRNALIKLRLSSLKASNDKSWRQ